MRAGVGGEGLPHDVPGELGSCEGRDVFARASDECRDGIEVLPVCLQGVR